MSFIWKLYLLFCANFHYSKLPCGTKFFAIFAVIFTIRKNSSREKNFPQKFFPQIHSTVEIIYKQIMLVPIYLNRLFCSETKRN